MTTDPAPTLKDLLDTLLDLASDGVQERSDRCRTQRHMYPEIAQEEKAAIAFLWQLRDIAEQVNVESDVDGIKAAHETNDHATLSIYPTDHPTWSTCRWVTAEGTAQETLELAVVGLAAGLYCLRENLPYEAATARLEAEQKEESNDGF
jgi:hypothetical protein